MWDLLIWYVYVPVFVSGLYFYLYLCQVCTILKRIFTFEEVQHMKD